MTSPKEMVLAVKLQEMKKKLKEIDVKLEHALETNSLYDIKLIIREVRFKL